MKRRVLILGGGCAGVAAAWALSRDAERRARYDVTLVQAGWRLGGKGATGRDAARGHRVLEHGLHLWLGWYRSAFGFLDDVYAADDGRGIVRSLDTAFSPMHDTVLVGGTDDRPEYWRLSLPPTPGRPWDRTAGVTDWPALLRTWLRRLPSALAPVAGDPGWTPGRVVQVAGLAAAVMRGLAADSREEADELDLRAWLIRHGATPAQADLPLLRGLYDLGFAYPDGVPGPGRGAMAAGAGVYALLRTVAGYSGAPFWRMNAGMGDTVFAPAWRVLRDRGVTFRFFHRVDRLDVRGDAVDAVQLGVQADAERVRPLVPLGDLEVWPDRPVLPAGSVVPGDLEAEGGACLRTVELRRGADFDEVVLAIPSTGHRRFASALMAANPRYRAMVEHTCAVPTVAAQLWLSRGSAELGWPGAPAVVTGLPGMFRTWADMSPVADAEAHAERPAGLAYLCGVAPPELFHSDDRAAASAFVAENLRNEARRALAPVWPHGVDDGVLAAPPGPDPWSEQYARANVAAWERYVLTLPGSTRYRLAPADSGFSNLSLAGDWTKTEVNGGCVEAAVSSGVAAAEAVLARG